MLVTFDFDEAFEVLTGYEPFPWQARLFKQLSAGDLPPAVDIPTGLGKTSVMALWLLARAAGARLPRRLVYVVDRRAVVDQATEIAKNIRDALSRPELEQVRQGLALGDRPLAISTLRGKYVDNREWLEDPAAPAIIVGTVDMIGSRLLFEGYGVSRRMRPYAAGLMGCDTLVMLDEAHLSRPFERLLRTIETGQRVPAANGAEGTRGRFTGPRATAACPPPFRVLPLSATLGDASGSERLFTLDDDDRTNEIVRARLEASKTLTIEDLDKDAQLDDVLAERAWGLMREDSGPATRSIRTLIYCNSRKVAEKVAETLRKRAGKEAFEAEVILFVGGRRVYEREKAARQLKDHGLIAGSDAVPKSPVFLVATSAGEVGVDLDTDHMVCDLVAWERMVQRLGRVNRRGNGAARVLVIDQGPPDKKQAGDAGLARHAAVRKLLEALPRDGTGGHRAGPAALAGFGEISEFQGRIDEASTPMPLYPALTRPLIDAWAMTSLAEHTGRPEVGPWLRGWVDEHPQTTVVWRRFLPVRFEEVGADTRTLPRTDSEIEAFFEAAPPQGAELLETETWRVADWLKKRARKLLKTAEKGVAAKLIPNGGVEGEDGDAIVAEAEGSALLAPLNSDSPVAFLLRRNGKSEGTLSLRRIADSKTDEMNRNLAGRKLVVDARLNGLNEGLLDASHDKPASTIEDNWGKPEAWEEAARIETREEGSLPVIRVRVLGEATRSRLREERGKQIRDSERSPDPWQETLAIPLRTSPEGDGVTAWLVVEKQRNEVADEEARAMAPVPQRLDKHQAWVALEATRIAVVLGLPEEDQAMLRAAALHHDDGKEAPRWQRAFNAPNEGGPYAKTAGPLNRHVLNGYRHEFKSMLDAEDTGLDGLDRPGPRFDLALHLIAAHHGRARPIISIEGCDSLPPTTAANRAHEAAMRFARLQRQWGPWGLAWWEALLRAADQRASRALDEAVSQEQPKKPTGNTPLATRKEKQLDLSTTGVKEGK